MTARAAVQYETADGIGATAGTFNRTLFTPPAPLQYVTYVAQTVHGLRVEVTALYDDGSADEAGPHHECAQLLRVRAAGKPQIAVALREAEASALARDAVAECRRAVAELGRYRNARAEAGAVARAHVLSAESAS